jgi:hypothetical protein
MQTVSRIFRCLARSSLPCTWDVANATVNVVSVAILAARIMQSLVHVGLVQTNTVVSIRFGLFFVQIVGFLWLIAIIAANLSSSA